MYSSPGALEGEFFNLFSAMMLTSDAGIFKMDLIKSASTLRRSMPWGPRPLALGVVSTLNATSTRSRTILVTTTLRALSNVNPKYHNSKVCRFSTVDIRLLAHVYQLKTLRQVLFKGEGCSIQDPALHPTIPRVQSPPGASALLSAIR